MVTPTRANSRDVRTAAGLWKAACLGVVSAALLMPSTCSAAQATAADDLVKAINQYRQQNNLPAIAPSPKLTQVAIAHVQDLVDNHPDTKLCPADKANMHSWSENSGKNGWHGSGSNYNHTDFNYRNYTDSYNNSSRYWINGNVSFRPADSDSRSW